MTRLLTMLDGVEAVSGIVGGRVRLVYMYVSIGGKDVIIQFPGDNPYAFQIDGVVGDKGSNRAAHNRLVTQLYARLDEQSQDDIEDEG